MTKEISKSDGKSVIARMDVFFMDYNMMLKLKYFRSSKITN
jgi:hypothetical protein